MSTPAPSTETGGRYLLRLFIAGTSLRSQQVIEAVRQACDARLTGAYDLEIVDIYQQQQLAEADRVLAAPTLVRIRPGPVRRIAGDLSDVQRILKGLGLDASPTDDADER
ncbi:circadian clock KaiB family protein [Methylobacterium organophilum]|uniref:Circadian clock protein KaiB n=1 Tax=Methylobacterium organophilum TaxID=410 RepID=A0ABQ4TBU1_METOR|nr:circadian clock KaiB family protein [Methylobacterium organophilum]GJE27831.1 Circadian clock protein KaiB [Methylobacterium organophilum]